MNRVGVALVLVLFATDVQAQVDHQGRDYTPVNMERITEAQVNLGRFHVPAGVTVFVHGAILIQAEEIDIEGVLDATGTGEDGGFEGDDCSGPVAMAPGGAGGGGEGGFGDPWPTGQCSGGGGHGGEGGQAELLTTPTSPDSVRGFGGPAHGLPSDISLTLGSGGGIPSLVCCPCQTGRGGRGGGAIALRAWGSVDISGTVRVNGGDGTAGASRNSGAGGGGSGGTLLIETTSLIFTGQLEARGGAGAVRSEESGNGSVGGGGGGGRIKIFGPRTTFTGMVDLLGGGTGTLQGGEGTLGGGPTSQDLDGDGILDVDDTCPADFFDDADGDGVCANTDPCPGDTDNDSDADGLCVVDDNCPMVSNADQADQDFDRIGDVCDPDMDGDGFDNEDDNCPSIANLNQSSRDGDDFGDECDLCPAISTTENADLDGDGTGDECDSDIDGDGVDNDADNCPRVPNGPQVDTDMDGVGDACADGVVVDEGVPRIELGCSLGSRNTSAPICLLVGLALLFTARKRRRR